MTDTISIDVGPILKKAREAAVAQVTSTIDSTASRAVNQLMDSGKYFGRSEGLGHEIIRKHVEEYILSDKFAEKVDQIIEEEAEAQMRSAARVLLHSKTRKHLFTSTDPASEG